MEMDFKDQELKTRLIAFYLPQFHPIPENDEWWGKGFTEWSNVVKAKPLFKGHYQPRIPADLGYYDLRLPEIRQQQADLASEFGIHGFCYYHYWFNGRRLLERPFQEVLTSGRPGLPFCLCWANENWTRTWDGLENNILLQQNYSTEDDIAHIRSLLAAFEDERYIRINGRPLFLVYRIGLLPDPKVTAEIWREEAIRSGIGEIYLASVESIGERPNPDAIGFDAAVEFAPDWYSSGRELNPSKLNSIWRWVKGTKEEALRTYSYDTLVENMLAKPEPDYKLFRGVTPSWDKTARRGKEAILWVDSSPDKYHDWLKTIVEQTKRRFKGDERLVFVNAWNEWAEGCYLEPDEKYGLDYLRATRRALKE